MKKHLSIASQPKVIATASRFAIIVGPVLVMINHGDSIIAGSMSDADWIKSALTIVVPYVVSTLSSISAYIHCEPDNDGDHS